MTSSEVRLFVLDHHDEGEQKIEVRIICGGLREVPEAHRFGGPKFVPDQPLPAAHLAEAAAFLLHTACSQSTEGFESALEQISQRAMRYRTTGRNPPPAQEPGSEEF